MCNCTICTINFKALDQARAIAADINNSAALMTDSVLKQILNLPLLVLSNLLL